MPFFIHFQDDFDCEISRDQGFIDTVVKKRRKRKHYEELATTPEKVDQKPFCFSPKSFYKSCPSESGRTPPLSQHHIDLATELIERKRRELSEKKSTKKLRERLISKAKLHQKHKKKTKARIVAHSSTQTIFKSQTLSAKKHKGSLLKPVNELHSSEPTQDLQKPPEPSETQLYPTQSKILRPPVLNVLTASTIRGRDEKQVGNKVTEHLKSFFVTQNYPERNRFAAIQYRHLVNQFYYESNKKKYPNIFFFPRILHQTHSSV